MYPLTGEERLMNKPKHHTHMHMDHDLWQRMKNLADKERRSLTSMVEVIFEEYLERNEKKTA